MRRYFFSTFAALLPTLCFGGTITLSVSLNTSPLMNSSAAPFSIDFQFNDGSGTGDANNTVTVSNLSISGGAAFGLPILSGGASGALNSQVALIDSGFLNEFIQGFTAGTSLAFKLVLTTNAEAGGVPDEFSFAILDATGVEIPTEALTSVGSDVFLVVNIDSSGPSVQTFAGDSTRSPVAGGLPISLESPTVTETGTSTPEPGSQFLVGLAGIAMARYAKNRRNGRVPRTGMTA